MPTLDPKRAPEAVTAWLERARPAIDQELEQRLAPAAKRAAPAAAGLNEAMRFAALGPGKRLRPALAIAACEAVGGTLEAALPAAAAVELLHAYTLVHDDLPSMDDDEMRRGRPTVHVAYGEATAVLAGDGLLTAAFGALADLGPRAAEAVRVLAERAGAGELLAGQARDLDETQRAAAPALADLEEIHAAKTGALFSAAAELGAIAAGAGEGERRRLARYGLLVGIAFQHADDRDDRDFQEVAGEADARRRALAGEAAELARSLGDPLLALALWFAGAP